MPHRLSFAALLIALSLSVTAQDTSMHIPSDVAASHLKSHTNPVYPPLAQVGGIQGNVILRVAIDSSGNVSFVKLLRGHPMLAPSAMETVRRAKYAPFELNGKTVPVITTVSVRFGNPTNHDAEDQAEVAFQDRFWAAMDAAQIALSASDFALAEQSLDKAQTVLSSSGSARSSIFERWQWFMSMGELRREQKQIADAEQNYSKAFNLQTDKNSPEAAASLSAFGRLYYQSGKPDQAKDKLKAAIAVYEQNYKTAKKQPNAQAFYALSIANNAWMLSEIAVAENQPEEAARQCQVVLGFRKVLPNNDAKTAGCERLTARPTSTAP